jgi:hypothetical protein
VEIATGIVCNWVTFNNLAENPGRVKCAECGDTHAWQQSEAWLAGRLPFPLVDARRKA